MKKVLFLMFLFLYFPILHVSSEIRTTILLDGEWDFEQT